MRYKTFTFMFILLLFTSPLLALQERNLLSDNWDEKALSGVILPPGEWSPYPSIDQRASWENLPEGIKKACIAAGEEALGYDWPTLPATVFMEFHLNGNRSNYQDIRSARRYALSDLVLAELIENKGRFMESIINGIWVTCEETYWGLPAHLSLQAAGNGLPDAEEPSVDLFAAETGAQLAWINLLLKPRLDEYHPLVSPRIEYEINRRILIPCLERTDYWWMGFEADRTVNNWNPWINSNWITCLLLSEKDPDRQNEGLAKSMRSIDMFIKGYPDDGGCDEGPSYWGHAGGSLFDCLDLLYMASGNKIDFFKNPLIRNIAEYIMKVHITDSWFINFADASARGTSYPAIIYRYGQRIENPELKNFASFLTRESGYGKQAPGGYLSRRLRGIFTTIELASTDPAPPLLRDSWLPDLQVFAARDKAGSSKGFYLAGKGGHNDESHNHNDVGNFIIYLDGQPAIIDAGVETYTKKTFSDQRYDIWTMQSQFHNLPTVNGFMQKNGMEFRAEDVQYETSENQVSFSLELAGAYPAGAALKSLKRSLVLARGEKITLSDRYELSEVKSPFTLNLLTAGKPQLESPGSILLADTGLKISFSDIQFTPSIETVEIDDSRLRGSWGERIYRVVLTLQEVPEKGEYRIEFSRSVE
jgi:Heparinase II/III-like protein